MVWFFERAGEFIRCETRETQMGQWELAVIEPAGAERVEHFETGEQLEEGIRQLHQGLLATGWVGPHGHFA